MKKRGEFSGPYSTIIMIILAVIAAIILFLVIRGVGNAFTP